MIIVTSRLLGSTVKKKRPTVISSALASVFASLAFVYASPPAFFGFAPVFFGVGPTNP